jgi:phosphate acetyltransferase
MAGLKADPMPAVVVAANSAVVMESVKAAVEAKLIEPILVGEPALIERSAAEVGYALGSARIVPAMGEEEAAQKGVKLASDGTAGIVMKGHLHTDVLMRAALHKTDGLRCGRRFTHVSHLTVPGSTRVLILTDPAINVLPDAATRMDLVRNAVDVALAVGIARPKVAMLSAVEIVNPGMPSSVAADETQRNFNAFGQDQGFDIAGPFAFDNAISPEAARIKGVSNPVAGQADIIVAPNIETANAIGRIMVCFMSATLAGVVMGAKVPFVLTSRADPAVARIASIALARKISEHKAKAT